MRSRTPVSSNNFALANIARFVLITILLSPALVNAQQENPTPSIDKRSQEIIDKCIEAMGGEMVLRSIETIEIKGEAQTVDTRRKTRNGGNSTISLKGNMLRSFMTRDDGTTQDWVDNGELTWIVSSDDPDKPLIQEMPFTPRDTTPWPGAVLNWTDSKKQITFIGSGTFADKKVHSLAFERADGALCHYHFSQETNLLHAVEFKQLGGGMKSSAYQVFDYQTAEGFVLPAKQTSIMQTSTTEYEFEVIKVGGEIPDEHFEMSDDLKKRWKEIQQQEKDK